MYQQVFGCGREIDPYYAGIETTQVVLSVGDAVTARQNQRVVEVLDDAVFDQLFYGVEVHHHAVGGRTLGRRVLSFNGDIKFIRVAVDVMALALIVGQYMGHLEGELLGKPQQHNS